MNRLVPVITVVLFMAAPAHAANRWILCGNSEGSLLAEKNRNRCPRGWHEVDIGDYLAASWFNAEIEDLKASRRALAARIEALESSRGRSSSPGKGSSLRSKRKKQESDELTLSVEELEERVEELERRVRRIERKDRK